MEYFMDEDRDTGNATIHKPVWDHKSFHREDGKAYAANDLQQAFKTAHFVPFNGLAFILFYHYWNFGGYEKLAFQEDKTGGSDR